MNKKFKWIATLAVAATMCVGGAGLAACGGHTHSTSKAWENDATNHWHICDEDGEKFDEAKHTLDTNGKCTVCEYTSTPATVTVDLTEGYYNRQADSTHKHILKFYEDGTFYGQGLMGGVIRGKYTVEDGSMYTAKSQDDGTISDDVTKTEWMNVTGKIIKFFAEDGTTPLEINKRPSAASDTPLIDVNGNGKFDDDEKYGYKHDAPKNQLIYDTENKIIYNVFIGGKTRTLTFVDNDFTKADEVQEELFKFMPDSDYELEEGKDASDYHFTILSKSFRASLAGKDYQGFWTKDGNVYTLTNLFDAPMGTLTVNESEGKAVWVNGNTTINFVTWKNVLSDNVLLATSSENQYQAVTEFRNDGTLAVVMAGGTSDEQTLGTAKWKLDTSVTPLPAINISEVSTGSTITVAFSGGVYKVTWTGIVSDLDKNQQTIEMTFAPSEVGKLNVPLGPSTLLTSSEASVLGGMVKGITEYYSDGTLAIIANKEADNETVLAKARWTIVMNGQVPSLVVSGLTAGTVSVAPGEDSTYVLTWVGKVNSQVSQDQTLAMSFAFADFAKLNVKEAKEEYTATSTSLSSYGITAKISFMSDGTLKVTGTSANGSMDLASATWNLSFNGQLPNLTITGTGLSGQMASNYQSYTVTCNATVGQLGAKEITFEIATSELAGLKLTVE